MNSRTKNAYRNIIFGLINKFVIIFLPFVNRTILVYVLGKEYLGLDGLFTSILQMLNIAELGFSTAILYSMYKPVAQKNTEKICALLNVYKKVYRIIGGIILGVGLLLIPIIPHLIKADLPQDINLVSLYLPFLLNTVLGYLLFAYKKSLISAFQREDILSNVNTIVIVFQTIIQIVLLFVFKKYYFYILVMPCLTVCENIIAAYYSKKIFPQYIPRGNIDEETKRNIKYRISGLMIQRVCTMSRNSLDSIVLSTYLGLSIVSIYGNYYYIMHAINVLMLCFTKSITSIVGNKIVEETVEENHKDMLKFHYIYMWLASVCTVCLLCLYQPFMKMWMGENMLLPTSVMVVMCAYFYSLCMGDIRGIYTTGTGLWWEGRYRSFLEAVSNLVLNIVLGKYFGIIGVVVATLFSIIVINFGYGTTIIYKYYFKNIKKRKYYLQNLYNAIITMIAGFIAFILCEKISYGGVVGISFKLFISIIISNVTLWLFYRKSKVYKEAKNFIGNIFRKVLQRG